MKIAYIFPGQGAQYVGMGKELYGSSSVAREIFDKANDVLGFDIKKLCFQGPQEELKNTSNCQPAILIHSIAALGVFESNPKYSQVKPSFMAGLSLGEYTALIASGVFSFEDGLVLVRKRAELMERASKENPGAMAAVLGLDREKVAEICNKSETEIANLNCPGQVVISGKPEAVNKAKDLAAKSGAKNVVILEVSGAFHCSLMKSAAEEFRKELDKVKISNPQFPVISNASAKEQISPEQIRQNLERQLYRPVLWEDSVRYITSHKVNTFLEIGPNKVLRGLLRRTNPRWTVYNIEKPQDIENLSINNQ